MEKKRRVPVKNYFILAFISIATIILTNYVNRWIVTYKESRISVSPMVECVSQILLDDLELTINESNNIVVYVSYTNDRSIYDFETDLVKVINKYNYNDYIYYLDVTDYLDNDAYIQKLVELFPDAAESIQKAPLLMYFKNGKVITIKDSKSKRLKTKDLKDLFDVFDIVE